MPSRYLLSTLVCAVAPIRHEIDVAELMEDRRDEGEQWTHVERLVPESPNIHAHIDMAPRILERVAQDAALAIP